MTQTELFHRIQNPFTEGTHYHRLFEAFMASGEITTKEIHRLGCDTARLRSDIRPVLRRNGMDYKAKYLEEGNYIYELRRN